MTKTLLLPGRNNSATPRNPPPRFATARNPDRLTLGPKVAQVARQLGTPFMPWQEFVTNVALEIDPDTGQLYYRQIVLLVPRQSGKTTILLSVSVHRAMAWAVPQRIRYIAQTGLDARSKWADDWLPALEESPLGKRKPKLYRVRKTNGQESILWRNGSMGPSPSALTLKSGHGGTNDLVFLDEAFAQVDTRVESSYSPTMITRPDRQFWVTSTVGETPGKSPYLYDKVSTGRERCLSGESTRVAYFEWSADDDADPDDPETWLDTMPAIGHTITLDDVQAEHDGMDPAEFNRAYLNRWGSKTVASVIPESDWTAAAKSQGIAGAPVLGLDVAEDRSWSTIVALGSGVDDPLGLAAEVAAVDRGTAWVAQRVRQIVVGHGVRVVAVDASGPAASMIPELERMLAPSGAVLLPVGSTDMGRACGGLLDDLSAGRLLHRNQPELNTAARSAARRMSGDTWRWSRSSSPVDISPLVALTVARWAHLTKPVATATAPDFLVV